MKIAHVAPTSPPDKGGMGNAAYRMAVETARLGHHVSMFTPQYRRAEEIPNSPVQMVRIRPLIHYGKAAFLPQLFVKLSRFEIVHLHYPFFGGAETVWLLKKRRPAMRLIVSYHMDVVGTGLKAGFFGAYTNFFLSRILSAADQIIVSSYDYADHSYLGPLVDRKRLVEIPYGVDERFRPAEKDKDLLKRWKIAQDEQVILFVGSLEYFKGVDCLIKAFPYLKGKIKLFIVGRGPLTVSLRALAEDLHVADRVTFVGLVGDEELIKYYNLSDIFILPSVDRSEAFGIVLVEAMACGKPVISSNLAGVRTVVDDGINGFLVPPGNIAEMADKLQLLIDRKDLRKEFGKRGRAKVLDRYVWQEVGRKLNESYSRL